MSFLGKLRGALAGAYLGFRSAISGGYWSYSDATAYSPDRGGIYLYQGSDSRYRISAWTRREVLRRVTWLFQNFGIIKEAVRGMARHTVGKGICLTLNTDDDEWNALAEADFEAWAMAPDRCDISGRRNFYELQNFAVVQRVKQGEFLAAFVANPRWEDAPAIQVFDALEVENPQGKEVDANTIDGVSLDENHCPQFYWVTGFGGKSIPYPRSEFVHWYFADDANQVRGVSEFAQAVAPLQDVRELIRITSKTAKQNAALGLHIKRLAKMGAKGALDRIRTLKQRRNVELGADPGPATDSPDTDNQPAYEKLAGGGAVIYTDENGDAKFLTPQSPTPLLEPFIRNVLMRDGLASIGGAGADFFWAMADINSAGQRAVLVKADLTFTVLGDGLIGHMCNPAAVRFLNDRMDKGKLRRPFVRKLINGGTPEAGLIEQDEEDGDEGPKEQWVEDTDGHWMSCLSWQLPQRLSIDNAKEAAAEIEQLNNNVETLSTLHDKRGRGWRPMVDQWFREFAYAARCAKRHSVPWALKVWRATMPGAQGGDPTPDDNDTSERVDQLEKDKKQPEPPAKK
ncbi:MAG: phage portal protein [Chthoniobacter sp.]|nr:phage portal protein [Chthoniobacter sp.]